MLKHYVEFLYPGTFISESSCALVLDKNPKSINLPNRAYGFRFFDREETILDGETLTGKAKNHSGWYYKGIAYTLEQIKEKFPQHNILISNMEINDYNVVVECLQGFVPLRENDTILR